MYRACYADGSTLHVKHGRAAMTEEIARFSNQKEADAFGRFSDWLEGLYKAEMRSYIDANLDSPLDLIKPWRDGLSILKMGGFGKLDKKVASFFDDQRLQQIFSFQSMYAGLAPYEALAIYAVITYMDSVKGVFVPEGGMHQMAAGLAEAVEKAGVSIRYSSPVSHIVRNSNGGVEGVRIGTGDDVEFVAAGGAKFCKELLKYTTRRTPGVEGEQKVAVEFGKVYQANFGELAKAVLFAVEINFAPSLRDKLGSGGSLEKMLSLVKRSVS
jgi:phytoene desaturase